MPNSPVQTVAFPRAELVPIEALKPYPRNARTHSKRQIDEIASSIHRFGFVNPVLIDASRTVLCGNGRLAAARKLGLRLVPALRIDHLSDAERRAYVIADNRLAEKAGWDREILTIEFQHLIELNFDVDVTGFSTGEIDLIIDGASPPTTHDTADDLAEFGIQSSAVSQPGDVWSLGQHKLFCGNALNRDSYKTVLGTEKAQMVVTDPPYNVAISGHAMGRGKTRHREFAMASGEMSKSQFEGFLTGAVKRLIEFSADGSIHFIFMDWRHLPELLGAALPRYSEWKNLLVWNKSNAGQGTFYRSKHELILALKNGTARHINNFELGASGRYRTNVCDYPGVNSLHPARRGDLELHPTVKPIALIADLIRDCSRRKGIILDPFCGSGTVLLAAERAGRVARAIELDPLYVDVAIRRFEKHTGIVARDAKTGLTFAEVEARRASDAEPLPAKAIRKAAPRKRGGRS